MNQAESYGAKAIPFREELKKQALAISYLGTIRDQNPAADQERIHAAAEELAEILLPAEEKFRMGMIPDFAFTSQFYGIPVVISKIREEVVTETEDDQDG